MDADLFKPIRIRNLEATLHACRFRPAPHEYLVANDVVSVAAGHAAPPPMTRNARSRPRAGFGTLGYLYTSPGFYVSRGCQRAGVVSVTHIGHRRRFDRIPGARLVAVRAPQSKAGQTSRSPRLHEKLSRVVVPLFYFDLGRPDRARRLIN